MFDGASNIHLAGELLKIHYQKISVMRASEHTVSLFFSDVSKILVLNQIITDREIIYNIFGSDIYHKPYSLFKSKSYEFHNKKIVSFIRNDKRMAGYFIEMHIYLRMRKALLATVSSAEFNTMSLN